jgi:endonuclease YncB( thermonuclease family)
MENTPAFSLSGLKCIGKVLHVYDGDTLWLAVVYPGHKVYRYRVRMYGYDAPELHPLKTTPNLEEIVDAAKRSTEKLKELTSRTGFVEVEFFAYDKYGRPMVKLTIPGQSRTINDQMMQGGFGVEYYGGKKGNGIPINCEHPIEEKDDACRSI